MSHLFHRDENYEETEHIAIEGLKQFYRSGILTDCEFIVGDNKIPFRAHKLVLAMSSENFQNLLYSPNYVTPTLMPDVNPVIFESLLRYIYLNDFPLSDKSENKEIIELWYLAKKFGLCDLSKKCNNKIKIDIKVCIIVLTKAIMLEEDSDVCNLKSRCLKLFSVKTPEVLEILKNCDRSVAKVLEYLTKHDTMSVESEQCLFQTLAIYAENNGWKPTEEFYSKKGDEKEVEFQEHIRDAIKNIRFLSYTVKEFDEEASKAGFLTEDEVKMIRDRIVYDRSAVKKQLALIRFCNNRNKKRYELLPLKFELTQNEENKNQDKQIDNIEFCVEFPSKILGITECIKFGMNWRVIIFERVLLLPYSDYTIYLKCEGNEPSWKCYAQLDIQIEMNDSRKYFENIPWYCFQRDFNYCQTKPFKLVGSKIKKCKMILSTSSTNQSYKNKNSNVSMKYGKEDCNYDTAPGACQCSYPDSKIASTFFNLVKLIS